MKARCGDLVSRTCLAGANSATSHSARNSMTLFSSLGRAFWTAWRADSIFGVCEAEGVPSVYLVYSSAKKRRHILETHWLALSMLIVILARGHGSGKVERQWSNSDVSSGAITGSSLSFGLYWVVSVVALPLLRCACTFAASYTALTTGRYIVLYIDNEASRLALIKAYSSAQMANVFVQMFLAKEDASQWKVWFGRVCSHSNIADAPSRMEVQDLVTRGAVQDQCAWDVVLLSLEEIEHIFGLRWRRVLRLSRMKASPKSWGNPLAWKGVCSYIIQAHGLIFQMSLFLICRLISSGAWPVVCERYTVYEYWYSWFDIWF